MTRKRGFTLIELLVVIAIIAILAAILFPVFARARDKANQTACISNLKQLALATLMYVQDYDEFMPFSGMVYQDPSGTGSYGAWGTVVVDFSGYVIWRWWKVIEPYHKSPEVLRCESYKFGAPTARDPNSYGYNSYALGSLPLCAGLGDCSRRMYTGVKLGEIPRPTDIIMIGPRYCLAGDSLQRAITYYWCLPQAHGMGDNFAFCDGHVKYMPMDVRAYTGSSSVYWQYWQW